MLYSDIQTNVQSILNRRDITPSQLATFIGMAIQRIQRSLRVPAMEATTAFVCTGTDGRIPVPGDLLEIISITFNDNVNQVKLRKVDQQSAIRLSNVPGNPTSYYRDRGTFLIGPFPPGGSVCYITYYQDASSLSNPTDHNWLTDAAPDLLVYGALCYAADYFLDERKQGFEQRFAQIMGDLQLMADDDELLNAAISPAYSEGGSLYAPDNNYGMY